MTSERVSFTGSQGHALAARLERPLGPVRAVALFAHCFTCSKESRAAVHISRALAQRDIATLRFDFTGLGGSGGEFANTDFSSNVEDLVAAADHLRGAIGAPALLIGHSLGGAAVLAAAGRIPEARAVATIGAPAEPEHVARLFTAESAEIAERGEAEVSLGGRRFRIRQGFLDDIAAQRLEAAIAGLGRALLVMHAPRDRIVGIDNASRIFRAAKHPKSFVSLDDADHLLSRAEDGAYAAEVIAAWASRYLPPLPAPDLPPPRDQGEVVVGDAGFGRYAQMVLAGPHRLLADEPRAVGGDDAGPTPYGLLLAALGACTAMTLRMYAEHKGWPLERTLVRLRHRKIHAEDCAECETRVGKIDHIDREIAVFGPLEAAQRERLLEIAERCPVHRTLHSEVVVESRLVEG